MATSEMGISGAHWRQTVSTGNARSISYFDGLLRPVLNRTYDLASISTTGTAVRKTFDHNSNVTFESYPQRDITDINVALNGVTNSFDALGRPTPVVAASELGNLTTTNTYGSPFTKTAVNPRGKSTTFSYYAWDTPSMDLIKTIAMPDSVNVTINATLLVRRRALCARGARSRSPAAMSMMATNAFARPSSLKLVRPSRITIWRITSHGRRLAKTCRPPLRATPVAWASTAKITLGYDGRNRLTSTTYGDASPSITQTYTGDSLPNTVTSNGSTWTNTYNKRRLLERESMNLNGTIYNIDRTYDANGALNTLKYPDGITLSYAPNALGRATTVGSYATAIAYHPNGAISGFNYGNGVAHSLTQNTRGLPRQSSDVGVMNDLYDYDANGNVAKITDQQEAITTRTMGYDDQDRLTSVSAPSLWGNATYGYDGLDNLTSSSITAGTTARTNTHTIDAVTNRLTNVSSTNAAFAFGYGYDARGNITQRGSQAYVFDIGNRVRSATGKATYSYHGFGRRTLVAQTDGTNRNHVYRQDGKLYNASQSGGPQPASTTKYIYINNHMIAEVDSVGGTQYSHTDGLGSPVARTNSVKTVLSRSRSDGTRTRTDFVTKDAGVVETKTGGAQLSTGQAKLKADIEAGRQVTPVGNNAAKAGLSAGQPTTMKSCTVDRPGC